MLIVTVNMQHLKSQNDFYTSRIICTATHDSALKSSNGFMTRMAIFAKMALNGTKGRPLSSATAPMPRTQAPIDAHGGAVLEASREPNAEDSA